MLLGVNRLGQKRPCLADFRRTLAVPRTAIVVQPTIQLDRHARPGRVGGQLVDHLVVLRTLGRIAEADQIARLGLRGATGHLLGIEVQVAADLAIAAPGRDRAEDPLLAEEGVKPRALRLAVAEEVEDQHPVVGHAAQEGRGRLLVPKAAVEKRPGHHYPRPLRIAGLDCRIDRLAEGGQLLQPRGGIARDRRPHLVEAVGLEEIGRAELLLPLADERPADLGIIGRQRMQNLRRLLPGEAAPAAHLDGLGGAEGDSVRRGAPVRRGSPDPAAFRSPSVRAVARSEPATSPFGVGLPTPPASLWLGRNRPHRQPA